MDGVQLLSLFAAICGLVAAGCWGRFAVSLSGEGEAPPAAKLRDLSHAAIATAGALGFASIAGIAALWVRGVL
jgi:hypothetical protein